MTVNPAKHDKESLEVHEREDVLFKSTEGDPAATSQANDQASTRRIRPRPNCYYSDRIREGGSVDMYLSSGKRIMASGMQGNSRGNEG